MRLWKLITVAAALSILPNPCSPQTIPILQERGRVIIPASINGSPPLKLILDTGMGINGVYLFRREMADQISASGMTRVEIPGAGAGEASSALATEGLSVRMGPFALAGQTVFIGQSEQTQGFPTDGVIGWSLFGRYIVEIDNDRSVMVLHDLDWSPTEAGWTRIPVEMRRDLPWFDAEISVTPAQAHRVRVYVDLAADDTAELLVGTGRPFEPPRGAERIRTGVGLSGDIHGWAGQIFRLRVAGYDLLQVPATWSPAEVRSGQDGAGAILGNGFFQHFNAVFDYPHDAIFIKPTESSRARAVDSRPSAPPSPQRGRSASKTLEELLPAPAPTSFTSGPRLESYGEMGQAIAEEYPPRLREEGMGGTVHVWCLVDVEGAVRNVAVNQGSGHEELDAAALVVARILRFTPARNGSEPVPAWMSVPVVFDPTHE